MKRWHMGVMNKLFVWNQDVSPENPPEVYDPDKHVSLIKAFIFWKNGGDIPAMLLASDYDDPDCIIDSAKSWRILLPAAAPTSLGRMRNGQMVAWMDTPQALKPTIEQALWDLVG